MVDRLFAYGTLQAPELLRAVLGEQRESCDNAATLHNFVRFRVRRSVYPGIIYRQGSATHGKIIDGISSVSWSKLDRFESALYRRAVVEVMGNDGRSITAQTYIIADEFAHRLSDETWDLETFRQKHLSRYLAAF